MRVGRPNSFLICSSNPRNGLTLRYRFVLARRCTLNPPRHMSTKKTTNRTADARLTIRLSTADRLAIIKRAADANIGVAEYMVRATLEQEIRIKPTAALPELFELMKIGTNLNQAVRLANTHKIWVREIEEIAIQIKAIINVHQG